MTPLNLTTERARADPQTERIIASDPIVAIATPSGEGAIGILRISGPGCLEIASRFLRNKATVRSGSTHELRLAPRSATLADALFGEQLLDRVIATFFPGPASYTGEDIVEIAAHGSPYVLARLMESALRAGARAARPGEFTLRAYLNGRMDLAQAEAVCALIRSRTELAHRAALGQMDGNLSRVIGSIHSHILNELTNIEASLDHPEEDIPELDSAQIKQSIASIRQKLRELAETYRYGRLAVDGARVVIAGPPNVGKSSLLNALVKRERAIVSEIPGTTRDTIEELASIGGAQITLVDTAGLRSETNDPIEKSGMERTHRSVERADIVILVLDRSRPLSPEDIGLVERMHESPESDRPVLIVFNKSDLPPASNQPHVPAILKCRDTGRFFEVSAKTGDGIAALANGIAEKALSGMNDGDAGAILISARHRQAIDDACAALNTARDPSEAPELVAVHLREALNKLAEISGATTTDDILRSIFSKFCIGK